MINRRLVWYLESHNLLTHVQGGFRSRCITIDHLVRFETFCREAFIYNQDLVSDILETPSYFVLPPWCIKPPNIVLDLVHLKKDCTDASVYQQIFMEIRDRYRDYIPVNTDGSWDGNYVAHATVYPSIFTAENWAIIKAVEEIKHSGNEISIYFPLSWSMLLLSEALLHSIIASYKNVFVPAKS